MNVLKKYKIAIAAVIVLIGFFYWLLSDSQIVPLLEEDKNLPKAIMKGNTLLEDKDGKRSWELYVEEIEVDTKSNENILTGIKGKLYRENGTVIEIVAKNGRFNTESREVTLTGDIVASYSEGWQLKCRELNWNPNQGFIVAKGSVDVTKDNLQITGDEIEADRDMEKIKINGNAIVKKGG